MTVYKRPSNRSTAPTNRRVTLEEDTEPGSPSGNNATLYNDGNVVRAKFSDGSTITIAQE